jgi:hypothetical protein
MVDDRPEDTGSLPDSERPKRAPPTIDLEATAVSTAASHRDGAASPADGAAASEPAAEPDAEAPVAPPADAPASAPTSPWIVAPVSGAVAAALVIGVGWMLGWPAVQPAATPSAPNAAAIDGLTARIAGLESKTDNPAVDTAAAARVEGLEKSLAALRSDLTSARAQNDKLAAAVNDVKSAPRADGAVAPDVSAVDERIGKIESLVRTQGAEIAQQGSKLADVKASDGKPADDMPLRRVVAGALLDVLVRIGDPFPAALATAKALTPNPDALKPLDQFAAKGVPNPARLSTELLTLLPKLLPAQQDNATTGSGVLGRLQAGAAKLVTIERTDTVGNDRGAVVARATAAALRNDFNEARRELNKLEPADRAAAQGWLEKADARDAALAASRQFAADAMAVLAKPAQ